MQFDQEGHVVVTPREVHRMALTMDGRARLINTVLLPGTPRAIPSHERYCDLLHHVSDGMGIHPNNLFFKGSTKLGFSIAPKAEKAWMEYGPTSDLDLAIVDPRFYQVVDFEVGRWEWSTENRGRMYRNQRLLREHGNRTYNKGRFDCFRFFDLPDIASMRLLVECLESAPVEASCGIRRPLSAFVYRDWWGVCKRYDHDLHCLRKAIVAGRIPDGGDRPRPYAETANRDSDRPDA